MISADILKYGETMFDYRGPGKLEREEAAAEAAAKTAVETSHLLLSEQLEEKFGTVPGRITGEIEGIKDANHLRYLARQLISVKTMEEFAGQL